MSRLACVYARHREYIVQPLSWTTTGLRIGTEPINVLPDDADAIELGVALRKALSEAKEGVAHPTDWKTHLKPLLQCAKTRSWHAFQKSAKMCEVEAMIGELRVTPSRNGGTSGPDKGYTPIPEQCAVLSQECSNEEIGIAILLALSLCC